MTPTELYLKQLIFPLAPHLLPAINGHFIFNRKRMMARMAEMQKNFYDQNKEELDIINVNNPSPLLSRGASATSSTEHVAATSAVGLASLTNHTPSQVGVTCILCQEEVKDVTKEKDKSFVLASCVQRSSVLRRSLPTNDRKDSAEIDFLSCRLDIKWGVFTSGCGHLLHAACWRE